MSAEITNLVEYDQPALFDILSEQEPVPGVTVNLGIRTMHLTAALGQLDTASRLGGLADANESPHRVELSARYGHNLDSMIGAAAAKRTQSLRETRRAFQRAAGYGALVESGLVKPDDAEAMELADYSVFIKTFADGKNKTARDEQKARLDFHKR